MREVRNAYRILLENLKGRNRLEVLGIDEMIILDWIENGKIVNWMHLTQDMDQWQAVMNMVINLQVALKVGNYLAS
jgi:hypothetical protein